MPGEGGGETLIFVPCRAKSGVPINQMAIGEGGFLFFDPPAQQKFLLRGLGNYAHTYTPICMLGAKKTLRASDGSIEEFRFLIPISLSCHVRRGQSQTLWRPCCKELPSGIPFLSTLRFCFKAKVVEQTLFELGFQQKQ